MKANIKAIILMGAPLLAGRLSHYSHQVADSIMMGHYKEGSLELGALAMAGMFTWVINTFLWPLSNGVQAIVSRRSGSTENSGKPENYGTIMDHGIITAVIVSFLALGLSFLASPLFNAILSDDRIISLALSYIRILRFSLLPFGMQMVIQRFFSSVQMPKYSMIASFISNAVNIILNYILIFGKLGLPEMGIRGAALGTVISCWAGFIYVLLVALKKEHMNKYHFFHTRKIDFKIIRNIVKVALPPAIQNVLAMLIMLFYEAMIENLGAVYLAATHIVFSSFRINKTIVGGFSHGTAILIGNALGAGDKKLAKRIMKAGYMIGMVIGFLVFLTVFFFPGGVARIFINSPTALATVTIALKFFAPFFLLEIIGFSFEMVFIGNGWGKFVLISEFITNILFILGFTFITTRVFNLGVNAAWWGFGLYQIFHSLILHAGYRSERWIHAEVESS